MITKKRTRHCRHVSPAVIGLATTERHVVDFAMMSAEATTEGEQLLFRSMRLSQEVQTKISSCSSESGRMWISITSDLTQLGGAYSIDHSSADEGEVQREDHAMAVILHPI